MSCKVQQSVCSDSVTYVKSRIKFNTFNTFNNVKNFNFYAPTQVVFGRNTETQVAELVKIYEMAR